MKVVVNGDDLGYTKANTLGIIEAYEYGILRSTTALSNSHYLRYAAEKTKGCPGLGVGVHLVLTLGFPLTNGKTFCGDDGRFLPRTKLFAAKLDQIEIRDEWRAQVERFIKVFGCLPTHLDSHHSVHDFNESQLESALIVAGEYGLTLRRHGPYQFVRGFYGDNATSSELINLLSAHRGEDIEIMAHPGYCDLELYRLSSYNVQRVKELDALCDARVRSYVDEQGIELTHY